MYYTCNSGRALPVEIESQVFPLGLECLSPPGPRVVATYLGMYKLYCQMAQDLSPSTPLGTVLLSPSSPHLGSYIISRYGSRLRKRGNLDKSACKLQADKCCHAKSRLPPPLPFAALCIGATRVSIGSTFPIRIRPGSPMVRHRRNCGSQINFRRHPPLEQARLPGLSSRFILL